MLDITARLAAIRNRIAARLPDVTGLTLSWEHGRFWLSGSVAGEPWTISNETVGSDETIVSALCFQAADVGLDVLPEIVLTEDSALTLAGHSLRIAETQTAVSAAQRPPVDHSHGYTAEMAEADLSRVARHMEGQSGEMPDGGWRKEAALLLSKLHCFKIGAPPESPGHAYARAVHDGETGPIIPGLTPEQEAAYRASKLGDQNLP